jgi:hypothetical protein
VGRAAFKKGSIPRAVAMPLHSPHALRPSTFRASRWGAPALPSPCYCWRSATSWGLALFRHRSASRIFIMQLDCSPSPMVIQVGRSKPGCGLCPALSFKDVHHPGWGGGRTELGPASAWAGDPLLPPAFGGEGHPPALWRRRPPAMRGKVNCCCLARVQLSVLHPGDGRAVRRWLLSPALRRGRTSTTRARSAASVVSCSVPGMLAQLALAPPPTLPPAAWSGRGCPSTARATVAPRVGPACLRPFPRRRLHRGIVQDVVRCEGGVRVLGLSCPHSGTTPPCGGWRRPVCEDLSGDLPVQAGAAAIRRRGAGAQVAAVIGAEVVAARGGCLRRRDRRRHLWSDLRLFGFDGLSSPLVWGRGRGPFHSSVCPEVIAAIV